MRGYEWTMRESHADHDRGEVVVAVTLLSRDLRAARLESLATLTDLGFQDAHAWPTDQRASLELQ